MTEKKDTFLGAISEVLDAIVEPLDALTATKAAAKVRSAAARVRIIDMGVEKVAEKSAVAAGRAQRIVVKSKVAMDSAQPLLSKIWEQAKRTEDRSSVVTGREASARESKTDPSMKKSG